MRNWFKNPGIYTSILYIIASGYFGKQLFQLQLLKNRDMAIVMLGVVIIGATSGLPIRRSVGGGRNHNRGNQYGTRVGSEGISDDFCRL